MKKKHPFKSEIIKIEKLSEKGNGIGHLQRENAPSLAVEVPFALPNDEVKALLMKRRRGIQQSQLEEVLIPSPLRISPKCVHFSHCGGCRFQNINYDEQLDLKQKKIEKLFKPFLSSDILIKKILPSSSIWNYRNKMEYTFSSDSSGRKYLGLILDSSRGKVFNLTECHLSSSWFVKALSTTRAWWHETTLDAYHPYRDSGTLRTLTVREGLRTNDRMVILTVSGNPDFAIHKSQIETFVANIRDAIEPFPGEGNLSIFLKIHQAIKGSPTQIYEMLLYGPDHIKEILNIYDAKENSTSTLTFNISPAAFFQPNTLQAELLYSTAIHLANITPDSTVYDLYCGTGTLGLCIAKKVKQVIGIEITPEAVLDARANAKNNGIENAQFFAGTVQKVLKELPEKGILPPDVIMVDPPRVGLDPETIKIILNLNPKTLVYVSCNPVTQALNISEFINKGYKIKEIQPVDQFPQNYHVENIIILCRN